MEEAPEVSAVAAATAALARHDSLSSEKRMEAEKVVLLAFRYYDKTCELGGGRREHLRGACARLCCQGKANLLRSPLSCSYAVVWASSALAVAMSARGVLVSLLARHARLLQAAGSPLWQTGCVAQPCDMATW